MFVPTGSMNTGRQYHTATILNDGKVLIAGGFSRSGGGGTTGTVATAELYDPAPGTFSLTGSMNAARQFHTATLLNNGMVLIAGGDNGSGPSAELYDPATGIFTPTGGMNTDRLYHTATLLKSGMVLITGGESVATSLELTSAELYNPATGIFTPTSSMNTKRSNHTATLLNNGMVLIAGGQTASAELFDPATGTFTLTGSMNTPRSEHAATLLNNGTGLVAGGRLNDSYWSSAESYDPTTGTFTDTGSMNDPRAYPTATLLNNGMVLVGGGFVDINILTSTELYNSATRTFIFAGNMKDARSYHTATLLKNGTVLVTGGINNSNLNASSLATAELYVLVALSPVSLAFSNQAVGSTSASQTVTLTNNQSTALGITSMAISGTDASDFAETDDCGSSVVAGASCTINMTFTPAAAGSRAGSLNIANNISGSPLTVPLTGTGVAVTRIVSLSVGSLTFTNQMVGLTSSVQGITLNNTGNSTLTVSGLAFSGTNASEFAETDNCIGSVAAGASCTINVTFSPTAIGTRTGTLNVTDNATSPATPQTLALTGTAIPPAPIVSLSSTSVTFPSQGLNVTSAPQTVTLRNAGATILNIQSVALTGAIPQDFAIASGSTCANGTSVAPNASCVFQLTFTPTGLLIRKATVEITDNAADSPETISLLGVTEPTPLVSVTPSPITFPTQYVGTSGLPQSVTVTNNGNALLSITSVTTSATDFGTLNACGSTVAAGSSCAIGVFFDPTASGTRSGTLTINDNAPGNPHTVALSGIGQDFSMASAVSTATVTAGQTATYSISVSPGGGFSQMVTFTCTGAPALSTCSVSPGSLALNGATVSSATVTVTTTAAAIIFPDSPMRPQFPENYRPFLLFLLLLAFAETVNLARRTRNAKHSLATVSLVLVLCATFALAACGGGSASAPPKPGTQVGTYSLVVTGTFNSRSTTLTRNATLTLVVR